MEDVSKLFMQMQIRKRLIRFIGQSNKIRFYPLIANRNMMTSAMKTDTVIMGTHKCGANLFIYDQRKL